MKSIRSEWINARGRNAAGFCFGGGLGRVERVEGRNKLGDGPFKPLILLAIAGSVPKNTQKYTPGENFFIFPLAMARSV